MMLTLVCLVFSDLLGYVSARRRLAIFTLFAFAILC